MNRRRIYVVLLFSGCIEQQIELNKYKFETKRGCAKSKLLKATYSSEHIP